MSHHGSVLIGSDYNEWAQMVDQIKKTYPLATQYLEKVYVSSLFP